MSIDKMLALFNEIDLQTKALAESSGLKCKEGCGACCTNPEMETTVAEVLPLAQHLWECDLATEKLELIQSKASQGICVLYEPDPVNAFKGRCSAYAYRPGICRLFGFSARREKHGDLSLVTCKTIKDSQSQACGRTNEALQKGTLTAPLLTSHAFSVSNIDPVHGMKLLPINQALGIALEKTGYGSHKN